MTDLVRVSFSIEKTLLDQLGKLVSRSKYENRSEFIRDMIRNHLVKKDWEKNRETLGTITVVYNHNARQLNKKLTDVQHQHHTAVLATTHVHLDKNLCGEMIMVKGPADRITEIANLIRRQKGVLHSSLSMSGTGKTLE